MAGQAEEFEKQAAEAVRLRELRWLQKILNTSSPDKRKKSQYELTERVGSGSYGVIYNAKDTLGEAGSVAIKCSFDEDEKESSLSLQMKRELSAFECLNVPGHENVLRSLNHIIREDQRITFIVMPYYPAGDLYDYLPTLQAMKTKPRMQQVQVWTGQLVRALEYMHGKGLCHRDFKSGNILVDKDQNRLIVCDFGLSRTNAKDAKGENICGSPATDMDGKFFSSRRVFTVPYRCPRFIMQPKGNNPFSVDVWSLGCVVGDMIQGTLFFKADTEKGILHAHFGLLGTPTEEYWPGVTKFNKFKKWERDFPRVRLQPVEVALKRYLGDMTAPVLAVLAQALVMNPAKRGSAADLVNAFEREAAA